MSSEEGQNSYKLMVSGLSPVFIGSGDKYSQLDYISGEGKIHILDFDKILSQIPFEVIDDLTNDIYENFENNRWKGEVEEFLRKYNINWKNFIEKIFDLIGNIGKNEINQFIKTGDTIYIPGSSLKGAIRTAILFYILENQPDEKDKIIKRILSDFNDREVKKLIQFDGKTDLLRALIISDSKVQTEDTSVKIVGLKVYHLKDKESTIPIFNEVLDKDFIGIGSLKINRKLVKSGTLISQYFNLQKDEIIKAINSFSKRIIEHELGVFNNLQDPNLVGIIDFYKDLKSQLSSLKDNECMMRLGQGSSALGITLFLNFSDNKEIINKFKGLEVIRFNTQDRKSPGYAIARQGRILILVDRKSEHRPRINETWLCSVVSKKRNNKFVSLLEKITTAFDIEKQKDFLFPLTRKFMVSNEDRLLSPFGWVKLRWE